VAEYLHDLLLVWSWSPSNFFTEICERLSSSLFKILSH